MPVAITRRVPFLHSKNRPASRLHGHGDDLERRLLLPWEYTYPTTRGGTHRITVQAGVVYRPSVPDVASVLVPERALWVGSLPHDEMYRCQGLLGRSAVTLECAVQPSPGARSHSREKWRWAPITSVSRRYADCLFHHLVRAVGTSRWRARLAYWAVRSPFGRRAWTEWDPDTRISPSASTLKR